MDFLVKINQLDTNIRHQVSAQRVARQRPNFNRNLHRKSENHLFAMLLPDE